ncbi:hypothetical protein [Criblamydia sequanensis]|uniref:Conserved putative membrane protein n=1 Tax=Candidatus Criblamydia sequanensis CRIB-18 TaxID=1437425 RepID=A0A090D345_9BACT|nr:hypothetical protein [Criblamydia sequanensis]CDR34923.1 Conserved putative membrane protein [Criblamydia sequanensis CRIB-18]
MTVELKTAFANVSSFEEWFTLLKEVKEEVSFFGTQYLYVVGYKGTMDIHAASRISASLINKNFEFTMKERLVGKTVVHLTDELYKDNDKRMRSKNFITKIICFIRSIFTLLGMMIRNDKGERFKWEMDSNKNFHLYYTKTQYTKLWGKLPDLEPIKTDPDRWYSNEYYSQGF